MERITVADHRGIRYNSIRSPNAIRIDKNLYMLSLWPFQSNHGLINGSRVSWERDVLDHKLVFLC